jgi:hypothetical protein
VAVETSCIRALAADAQCFFWCGVAGVEREATVFGDGPRHASPPVYSLLSVVHIQHVRNALCHSIAWIAARSLRFPLRRMSRKPVVNFASLLWLASELRDVAWAWCNGRVGTDACTVVADRDEREQRQGISVACRELCMLNVGSASVGLSRDFSLRLQLCSRGPDDCNDCNEDQPKRAEAWRGVAPWVSGEADSAVRERFTTLSSQAPDEGTQYSQ